MSSTMPRSLLRLHYFEAAQAYLKSLPPEHFMEATAQATQRKITLESLDLVHARRPDVQIFNELLVQYPLPKQQRPGQVVPDNMIVVHPEPLTPDGSFDVVFEPAGPFCMLEYVSKHNKRKDYNDNMRKYERELKVPYYLLFYPDALELTLFRHNTRKYVSVKPNAAGRLAIEELELEVALQDGWVRYWFRGELLPLPADLQRDLDETRRQLFHSKQAEEMQTRRADAEAHRANQQTERADKEKRRADEEQNARLRAEDAMEQMRLQLQQLRDQLQKS